MKGLEQVIATFREEAADRLDEVEEALLELESAPGEIALIDRIFRAIHTVKGSSGMFGLDAVSSFAHEVEAAFEHVRSGRLAVTRPLIDLSLTATDLIRTMLAAPDQPLPADRERIVAGFRALSPGGAPAPAKPKGATPAAPSAAATPASVTPVYRVRFRPGRDLLRDGTNPTLLLRELRDLGPCEIVADTIAIPALDDIDPEACYASWEAVLTTSRGVDAIRDVFILSDTSTRARSHSSARRDPHLRPCSRGRPPV